MSEYRYAADIVFVIDVTGSMHSLLEYVKSSALTFHEDLQAEMRESGRPLSQLRIRVVAFRDFNVEGSAAIAQSPFFTLPEQAEQYKQFVDKLRPTGGGDAPESGLEALWVAMNSDWDSSFDKSRHLIVVFTDTSAHPLGSSKNVPEGITRSADELTDFWSGDEQGGAGMDPNARRLLLFAPAVEPWISISGSNQEGWGWDQVLHFESKAGHGLDDVTFTTILHQISNSI